MGARVAHLAFVLELSRHGNVLLQGIAAQMRPVLVEACACALLLAYEARSAFFVLPQRLQEKRGVHAPCGARALAAACKRTAAPRR